MKVSPLSVRLISAALLGFFLIAPSATSAGASKNAVDPTFTVSMTAYNAVADQTDGTPFVTASGAYSDPNIVAARSPDLASELPFGTVIEILAATSSPSCGYAAVGQQIGLRVIADSMNAKMHDKIDILLPQKETTASGKTENPALVLGVCKDVTIKVVGHIDVADIPQTQTKLASALDPSQELAVAK